MLLLLVAGLASTATTTAATSSAAEDSIIIVPEAAPPPQRGEVQEVIIVTPEETPAPAPERALARTSVRLEARFGLDTSFDQQGENIAELGLGARLEIDVDITADLSAYAAPHIYWLGAVSREGEDRELTLLSPPEAHVAWALGAFDLRAGLLIFNWGASDLIGPADVLNPYDYRRNFVAALDDAKIPVPAVQVTTRLGPLTLRGVIEPFFLPSRFHLFRWDTALFQPGLLQGLRFDGLQQLLGAETLDEIGDGLLITERPKDRPDNATFGARATLSLDDLDLSLTAVHGWEPLPEVYANPDLLSLAAVVADSVAAKRPIMLTSEVLATIGRVQDALQRGDSLFRGAYGRRDLIGADAVLALDPFVLKADVAYTLERTSYTQDNRPVRHPWLNAVLGAEYFNGDSLQVVVEAFALSVLDVRSNERLSLFEPRAAPPSSQDLKGRTIAVPGLAGFVRYAVLDGDLRFDAALVATLSRGDLLFSPSIHYRLDDAQELILGGTLIQGRSDGYGGIYSHDDQLFLQYAWSR